MPLLSMHGLPRRPHGATIDARVPDPSATGSDVPEKIFAAAFFFACLVLLLRVLLGERRRTRFDAAIARFCRRFSARFEALVAAPGARRRARREAAAAIRRAKGRGDWEGNVYRPKSFTKDRKLH